MYGLRTCVLYFQGFWDSSSLRYFLGINGLPVIVLLLCVVRTLFCIGLGGLWDI